MLALLTTTLAFCSFAQGRSTAPSSLPRRVGLELAASGRASTPHRAASLTPPHPFPSSPVDHDADRLDVARKQHARVDDVRVRLSSAPCCPPARRPPLAIPPVVLTDLASRPRLPCCCWQRRPGYVRASPARRPPTVSPPDALTCPSCPLVGDSFNVFLYNTQESVLNGAFALLNSVDSSKSPLVFPLGVVNIDPKYEIRFVDVGEEATADPLAASSAFSVTRPDDSTTTRLRTSASCVTSCAQLHLLTSRSPIPACARPSSHVGLRQLLVRVQVVVRARLVDPYRRCRRRHDQRLVDLGRRTDRRPARGRRVRRARRDVRFRARLLVDRRLSPPRLSLSVPSPLPLRLLPYPLPRHSPFPADFLAPVLSPQCLSCATLPSLRPAERSRKTAR